MISFFGHFLLIKQADLFEALSRNTYIKQVFENITFIWKNIFFKFNHLQNLQIIFLHIMTFTNNIFYGKQMLQHGSLCHSHHSPWVYSPLCIIQHWGILAQSVFIMEQFSPQSMFQHWEYSPFGMSHHKTFYTTMYVSSWWFLIMV